MPFLHMASSKDSANLAPVIHHNIRTISDVRKEFERRRTTEERIADAITGFVGSMVFVYLHALIFGGWIVGNLGWIPGVRPWDPFPFVMLAMIASVEAIFLSTFVLITQNRMNSVAERRAELDLQINLLTEHELTRLIILVEKIGRQLNVGTEEIPEFSELKKDVSPDQVLKKIEEESGNA